jgi:hypothetical protein
MESTQIIQREKGDRGLELDEKVSLFSSYNLMKKNGDDTRAFFVDLSLEILEGLVWAGVRLGLGGVEREGKNGLTILFSLLNSLSLLQNFT